MGESNKYTNTNTHTHTHMMSAQKKKKKYLCTGHGGLLKLADCVAAGANDLANLGGRHNILGNKSGGLLVARIHANAGALVLDALVDEGLCVLLLVNGASNAAHAPLLLRALVPVDCDAGASLFTHVLHVGATTANQRTHAPAGNHDLDGLDSRHHGGRHGAHVRRTHASAGHVAGHGHANHHAGAGVATALGIDKLAENQRKGMRHLTRGALKSHHAEGNNSDRVLLLDNLNNTAAGLCNVLDGSTEAANQVPNQLCWHCQLDVRDGVLNLLRVQLSVIVCHEPHKRAERVHCAVQRALQQRKTRWVGGGKCTKVGHSSEL